MEARVAELERQIRQEREQREAAERGREAAERGREAAEERVKKTTLFEYLAFCHNHLFSTIKVQTNPLLATTGTAAAIDGKVYPRHLKPWTAFPELHKDAFDTLQAHLGDKRDLPSQENILFQMNRLSYGRKKLASEADLRRFSSLAIEGSVEDVLDLLYKHRKDVASHSRALSDDYNVMFTNDPFGVISNDSDEDENQEQIALQTASFSRGRDGGLHDAGDDGNPAELPGNRARDRGEGGQQDDSNSEQQQHQRQPVAAPAAKNKKLIIRDDRPAYLGALAVAKRDIEAAEARAQEAQEQGDPAGAPPRKKRMSPDRSKLHPDLWCFRYDEEESMVPVFVIEYKAAHKVDNDALRRVLRTDPDDRLVENCVRSLDGHRVSRNPSSAEIDVVKIITQAYGYMVDYGLQYGYISSGLSFIFLHLDPSDPLSVYYHLEQPKTDLRGADLTAADHAPLRRTAVALILSFVIMSLEGKCMTQSWKRATQTILREWPKLYDDMNPASSATSATSNAVPDSEGQQIPVLDLPPRISLPFHDASASRGPTTCRDTDDEPKKRRRRRDGDEDDSDYEESSRRGASGGGADGGPNRHGDTAGSTDPRRSQRIQGKNPQSSGQGGADEEDEVDEAGETAPGVATNAEPASRWTFDPFAEQTPTLPYCTQECLLSLKRGAPLDPCCPNVRLHLKGKAAGPAAATKLQQCQQRQHPISAAEFCSQLVAQFSRNMDDDCQNLERFGKFGATGALFKVALSAYGYCLVAKAVQRQHLGRLRLETMAYERLEACQGTLVPVCLGIIHLEEAYRNMFGAHFTHMLLLSYCGEPLYRVYGDLQRRLEAADAEAKADVDADGKDAASAKKEGAEAEAQLLAREQRRAEAELASIGVVHSDINSSNLVWNEPSSRVMVIDFDRAMWKTTLGRVYAQQERTKRKRERRREEMAQQGDREESCPDQSAAKRRPGVKVE